MVEAGAVTGFQPSTNGLGFANRFPPGPTVRFGPLDPRWLGVGDASQGLCGGMSWYVRERFAGGLPVPADTDAPANGSALFKTLVRRQVQSLRWGITPLRFWWMGALASRAAARSRGSEVPKIRAEIDAGRLVMVGLLRHTGINPFRLTDSHQVLAFAYGASGDTVTLRLYDPNWPKRDDVTVTIDATGLRQSTGEELRGVLALG